MGYVTFWRRFLAVPAVVALLAGGASLTLLTVAAAPAGATTFGPVDPTLADGATNSLRDIMENQVNSGDTVVLQPGATYTITHCTDPDIDIRASLTLNGNGATIKSTCVNGEGGVLDTSSALTINSVILTGGSSNEDGGAISDFGGGALVVNNSALIGNHTNCEGGGIYHGEGGSTTVVNSTIANNSASDLGGGIHSDFANAVTIVNSTITGNTAPEGGGIDASTPVTLVYTTLVNNTQGGVPGSCGASQQSTGADAGDKHPPSQHTSVTPQQLAAANLNIEGTEPVNIFGTVIALPHGATNCAGNGAQPLATITSAGYNYSDDGSCGLTGATDKQNASDPMLGALGANGGLAPTMLPQTGSPLIDAIPVAACGGGNTLAGFTVTTDERGITRPQGAGCEIGAVEVVPAVLVVPLFTG
ncbi:MAG TPA: choice-of-anchor Q domain-containing protein [Acidimicrobiia bacterium]|nr:choice-of-anchor Q domain-containing protein [Acidimicrobiia bacterium]